MVWTIIRKVSEFTAFSKIKTILTLERKYMAPTLYLIITSALFILLICTAVMFYKSPSWALAMFLPIMVWLIFDPLVLSLGNALGEGGLLYALMVLRYLLRVVVTPFLLFVVLDQVRRAGYKSLDHVLVTLLVGIIILVLVFYGIFSVKSAWEIGLQATLIEDIKQYKESEPLGLPIATILTYALVSLAGLLIFLKTRIYWLLPGALLALAAIIIPETMIQSSVLAATSIVLVLGFLITEKKLQKITPNPLARK
jgi:hypothetical protein